MKCQREDIILRVIRKEKCEFFWGVDEWCCVLFERAYVTDLIRITSDGFYMEAIEEVCNQKSIPMYDEGIRVLTEINYCQWCGKKIEKYSEDE